MTSFHGVFWRCAYIISATIAWNLITSYDNDLPYTGRGIMGVANTPWCGAFEPCAPTKTSRDLSVETKLSVSND